MKATRQLRAGDWVEVRSKEEILATLDGSARLESLPFMPEMFQYCGRRLQVHRRAHKTCDPPNGMGGRRMRNAVHLSDVRCGGEHHGGCQAGCLIFWKSAWLKQVQGPAPSALPAPPAATGRPPVCTADAVFAAVYRNGVAAPADDPAYACQSTDVEAATTALPWWDLRQYGEDVASGNVRVRQIFAGMMFYVYHTILQSGIGLGSAMRSAYDLFQKLRGGTAYPWRPGKVPKGTRTPSAKLDLRVGETVKVRPYAEILETVDDRWKNRGMYFDAELVTFCGGEYEVLARVERIIDEKTGKMLSLKNDAIILKDVTCQARYSKCRHFCPRGIYPYWREIWLQRSHATDAR